MDHYLNVFGLKWLHLVFEILNLLGNALDIISNFLYQTIACLAALVTNIFLNLFWEIYFEIRENSFENFIDLSVNSMFLKDFQ